MLSVALLWPKELSQDFHWIYVFYIRKTFHRSPKNRKVSQVSQNIFQRPLQVEYALQAFCREDICHRSFLKLNSFHRSSIFTISSTDILKAEKIILDLRRYKMLNFQKKNCYFQSHNRVYSWTFPQVGFFFENSSKLSSRLNSQFFETIFKSTYSPLKKVFPLQDFLDSRTFTSPP